jgi:uncharacterized membrane protein
MAYLAETIWNAMGWCPMHAAVQQPADSRTGYAWKTAGRGDGGSVAQRSARFMRLAWGVVTLSWIVAILVLPYLPEIIPIHWGLHGEPNGFADRITGTLGLPVITTLIMVLLLVLPRFDSVQISLMPFRDSYAIIILATVSMIFCIEVMTLGIAMGICLPVVTIISILIGVLFIVMGSLMPHIGRNTTMGIRLPWTLASDEIWQKTHEYGGKVFVASGVLVVLGSFIAGIWAIALMLVIIFGSTLYICIWSYRLAKTVNREGDLTCPLN